MQPIEEVYKMHSNTVYKYLICLTQDEDISEDLTQETFAIAVKEIKKFKGDCKVSVWLCQIAKHLWYQELKKRKKYKKISIEEIENLQTTENTEEYILKKEEKIELFKNIQKLDELSRQIIYLKMVGNLNFIEIAEILGKTANWARVTFYRAKQKLKEENENEKK